MSRNKKNLDKKNKYAEIRTFRRKLIWAMAAFTLIAIILESLILAYVNKVQNDRMAPVLIDQVQAILQENKEDEQELLENLKADYIDKARAIAYTLNYNNAAKTDVNELRDIAQMMKIDEIHLFDKNGIIYSGTIPEYYGMSFDSGKQISYFKPMLKFKHLTMCQDITPNTASARRMMYAIAWDETGTYMVQVGVAPVRLIREFQENNVSEVVKKMPTYEGTEIFVSNVSDGEIVGSTSYSSVGKTIYEIGIADEGDNLAELHDKERVINKYLHYCHYRSYDDYIITVVNSTSINISNFLTLIAVELLWLFIAVVINSITLMRLVRARARVKEQMELLSSIADVYYTMYYIDLMDYSYEVLEQSEQFRKLEENNYNAKEILLENSRLSTDDLYVSKALEFVDLGTLPVRLKGKKIITTDIIDKKVGWLRLSMIMVDADEYGVPLRVVMCTQDINEEKKREEELSIEARRDELTGLRNRRSYERHIENGPISPDEYDFVYIAIDINGLKRVNDDIGHAAGDELIKAAAFCMKQTVEKYGKVYRIGGDEFVAMILADEEHLKMVLSELDETVNAWRGEQVSELSIAVGYATRREFADISVVEIAKIADQRMYEAKNAYYMSSGRDRRLR